jgi:hypothetical protein
VPREAVETITGMKRSTITLYYRKYHIGEIVYKRDKKRLGLMFSTAEVERMLSLFKSHTSHVSRKQAQLGRSKTLWYEFLQRIIYRIDQAETDLQDIRKRIWALEHPPDKGYSEPSGSL